jgi:hypothetical protein
VIKLRCEEFDELIYFFWDGRIDERKKAELEEHLSICNRCKEKLVLLESIEGKAKQVRIKEPSQEYWDTFSNRVRERIIAQKEGSFSFRLKKVLENIFTFSPMKIKIAAGVVSVVFVFVVGKLYMDYRGKEIVPSKIMMEETKKPTPPADLKEMAKPKGMRIPQEEKIEKKGRIVPPKEESKLMEALTSGVEGKGEKMPTQAELRKMEVPPEGKVQREEKSVPPAKLFEKPPASKIIPEEEPKIEVLKSKDKTASARAIPTGAGEEKVTPPEERGINVESIPQKETTKTGEAETSYSGIQTGTIGVIKYYEVNNEKVPDLKYENPFLKENELRKIIDTWNKYIEKNPKDSLTNEGYLQVAIGYYLLTKLIQDESELLKGIELLEKYEKQVTDPKIKEQLNKKLKQLKALQEK